MSSILFRNIKSTIKNTQEQSSSSRIWSWKIGLWIASETWTTLTKTAKSKDVSMMIILPFKRRLRGDSRVIANPSLGLVVLRVRLNSFLYILICWLLRESSTAKRNRINNLIKITVVLCRSPAKMRRSARSIARVRMSRRVELLNSKWTSSIPPPTQLSSHSCGTIPRAALPIKCRVPAFFSPKG